MMKHYGGAHSGSQNVQIILSQQKHQSSAVAVGKVCGRFVYLDEDGEKFFVITYQTFFPFRKT